MTISSQVGRVQYNGNGVTVLFTVPFKFFANGDLLVIRQSSVGIDTALVLNVDYTAAGAGVEAGGSITTTVAPASGEKLSIILDPDLLQSTDYVENDPFPAESHERGLDRVTQYAIRSRDFSERAIKLTDGDIITLNPLPGTAARQGKFIAFDANGQPIASIGTGNDAALRADLASTTVAADGGLLVGFRRTEAGAVGRTVASKLRDFVHAKDFGAVVDGITDDTTALNSALAAAREVRWEGTLRVTSQIVLNDQRRIQGIGASSDNAVRGATCLLRAFAGANATLLASGDDSHIDGLDVDNDNQGTGECVQFTGSRFVFGIISCRKSGGDGLRGGKTNAGASDTNSNCWSGLVVMASGNAGAGFRLDDTNTTTSLSYPLGLSNINAGHCGLVDARSNGTDGLQIGNANDNCFDVVHGESNAGCGARFKTDGTNAGPRANIIVCNDCEANTGNDIQIDAATLPASGPGLYNKILGNRSVAVSSRIVDNSTGSLVVQWLAGLPFRAYHFGSDVNALALSGQVGFNAFVGANNATVRVYGVASGSVDSIMRGAVRKNGAALTDAWEANQHAVFKPLTDLFAVTYSASMTIDAATGNIFQISANNGTAFTINAPTNPQSGNRIIIQIRNTSGGALGAATWNAVFKMSAWTNPANGQSRSIGFFYNGANWIQYDPAGVDVPN